MNGYIKSIKANSLKDIVYQNLLDAIFTGELLPGDSLREMHLAQALSVSQASIREALLKLENVGLVIRVPNKGSIVTKLSNREIRERLTLRLMLEEVASVAALERTEAAGLAKLERRLNDLAAAVAKKSHFETAQADLEFHRCIWEMSDNQTLYRTLDQLTVPLFAFLSVLRRRGQESLDGIVAGHELVWRAFESGSAERVKTVTRQHVGPIYKDFLESGIESLHALTQQFAQQSDEQKFAERAARLPKSSGAPIS